MDPNSQRAAHYAGDVPMGYGALTNAGNRSYGMAGAPMQQVFGRMPQMDLANIENERERPEQSVAQSDVMGTSQWCEDFQRYSYDEFLRQQGHFDQSAYYAPPNSVQFHCEFNGQMPQMTHPSPDKNQNSDGHVPGQNAHPTPPASNASIEHGRQPDVVNNSPNHGMDDALPSMIQADNSQQDASKPRRAYNFVPEAAKDKKYHSDRQKNNDSVRKTRDKKGREEKERNERLIRARATCETIESSENMTEEEMKWLVKQVKEDLSGCINNKKKRDHGAPAKKRKCD